MQNDPDGKDGLAEAKRIMARMVQMPPKPHDEMKVSMAKASPPNDGRGPRGRRGTPARKPGREGGA